MVVKINTSLVQMLPCEESKESVLVFRSINPLVFISTSKIQSLRVFLFALKLIGLLGDKGREKIENISKTGLLYSIKLNYIHQYK